MPIRKKNSIFQPFRKQSAIGGQDNNKYRLDTLDSFRFIAILIVMLFHYYSRWFPLYPYGSEYNFFRFGLYGVEFFFIISGFVITFTLHNTKNIAIFWKKRFIRLWPTMALASFLTLIACLLLDRNNVFSYSHRFINYIFSLTFLSPHLNIFSDGKYHFSYIDAAYWSLWPEIQFYFVASIIYFLKKKQFTRNFFIIGTIIFCIKLLFNHHIINHFEGVTGYLNLFTYILWFLMGVIIHEIYVKGGSLINYFYILVAVGLQLSVNGILENSLLTMMIILFGLFIHYPKFLSKGIFKFFSKIGVASYFLYLIHENIGVLLINKYASCFGNFAGLFPILVIIMMSAFSFGIYKYFEKPVSKLLRKLIIK